MIKYQTPAWAKNDIFHSAGMYSPFWRDLGFAVYSPYFWSKDLPPEVTDFPRNWLII